jgi:hypothetical protein
MEAPPSPLSSRPERTRISYLTAVYIGHGCGSPRRETHGLSRLRQSRQENRSQRVVERSAVLLHPLTPNSCWNMQPSPLSSQPGHLAPSAYRRERPSSGLCDESEWKRHPPLCHPDRSGGTCCSTAPANAKTSARVCNPPPCHPPGAFWGLRPKNARLVCVTNLNGSATLPLCHPDRSGGTCCSTVPANAKTSARVAPSAYRRERPSSGFHNESGWKRNPPLCHPDRSGGICCSTASANAKQLLEYTAPPARECFHGTAQESSEFSVSYQGTTLVGPISVKKYAGL